MLDKYPNFFLLFFDNIPYGSSVFSLGMGTSSLEVRLFRDLACQVKGIDFVKFNVEWARQRGLTAIEGNIHDELDRITEKFDIIVMSEVLGDLDAYAIFEQLRPLLKSEGKILLSTYLPHSHSRDETGYERRWTSSLNRILIAAGFAIVRKGVYKTAGERQATFLAFPQEVPNNEDVLDGYVFYEIRPT